MNDSALIEVLLLGVVIFFALAKACQLSYGQKPITYNYEDDVVDDVVEDLKAADELQTPQLPKRCK